jgi:cytosine/adenosine deaminase-related metal-dependent hydrolase
MQTLIHCKSILTMNAERRVVRGGGILISEGRIRQVLSASELQNSRGFAGEVVDASHLVAIPGFIQTHIHLCQTLFRGLADDLELLDWLRLKIFPFEAAHSASSIRASAMLGIAELLRSGTTTIMDMGTIEHEEEIVAAIDEMGIRAFVGKAMMDINDQYSRLKEPTEQSLMTSRELAERYHDRADGRIRYAFAPRFVLSCSERLLRETFEMVQSLEGALFHTHAAENKTEMQAVRTRCGMGNIEYFGSIGILDSRSCLAHCIWLNEQEIEMMAERSAKVLHCPSSNLKLGSGVADVPAYAAKNITVSLGADGAPCNNNLDMFSEMRLAALIQKPKHGPRSMDARTVFEMATIGGAKALGIDKEVGSIEAGKKADIALLDLDSVWNSLAGDESADPYSTIVYSCDPRNVDSVMVGGAWRVRDGELLHYDERVLTSCGRQELKRLLERVEL